MKNAWILLPLAFGLIAATEPSRIQGQEKGSVVKGDTFRILRSRDPDMMTRSQMDRLRRFLGRRGVSAPTAKSRIAADSATRQQSDQQRLQGVLPADGSVVSEPLRARFEPQSKGTATLEQRVVHARQTRPNGVFPGQRTAAASVTPSLRTPAPTEPLSYSWRDADDELARKSGSRAFNQRFQNRILANGRPNYEQLRSRISQTGSDPRTMNARLGRTAGSDGSAQASRYGSSRVRRR